MDVVCGTDFPCIHFGDSEFRAWYFKSADDQSALGDYPRSDLSATV